jgi:hypothetical protein
MFRARLCDISVKISHVLLVQSNRKLKKYHIYAGALTLQTVTITVVVYFCHSILNRWENYFSQLLNMHNASDVRQKEVHSAKPLGPVVLRLKLLLQN